MANTINTNGGLSLTVIATEALKFLDPIAAQLSAFSTDFSPEVANVGAAISTRIVTPMTSSVYDSSTGYASAVATATAVTVNLNQHYFRTVQFTPVEAATIGLDKLMSTYVGPAVSAVGNDVIRQVYSLVTIGNYPVAAFSASNANFNFNVILSGSKVLDISGSQTPRATVLNPTLYPYIVSELKQNYVIGDNSAIREGKLGRLDGSDTYKDALLTSQGQGLAGFIAGQDAIAIATRVPPTPGGTVESVLVEGKGGLTLQLQRYYIPHLGQWAITAELIFGVVKGNGSSLVRFVDTLNP